ncbi:MAG: electron transfer flavoprotein subunit alpha [Planctomycetes bacterium]|nr:electron transfer flavoprotein subunit alpha [Planctomycetota bacterium]
MGLLIEHETCTLCGLCVEKCPYGALQQVGGRIRVTEQCTLCGACVEACPAAALSIEEGAAAAPESGAWRGVWVYGEHDDGRFHPVVFELIGKGAQLARALNCPLSVATAGVASGQMVSELTGLPVQSLYVAENKALGPYRDAPHARALATLVQRHRPEALLAGATARGRSLMPRVAVLCRTGLTADCTGLDIDAQTGNLLQTRPAFGGNIMATIETRRHRPQMATVRPRVMTPPSRRGTAVPALRRVPVPEPTSDHLVQVISRAVREEERVHLTEADVLIAGGRGLGGAAGFELLRELAETLGGEIGASRAAVDAGWIPYAHQVGQTGKTVQPDLYVAVGISGALQHRAGMQSSGTIVAVNTDPNAPIFQVADYGVVGDYRAVLPQLIRRLRQEER